jgi:hypothetical protein
MNKERSKLYIAGKVEASEEFAGKGVSERDDRYIRRDEQVKIHIGVGAEVYTYIVNPKGALLDTQDITIFWNPDAIIWNSTATAAARTNQDGWQFEVEIPLDELNIMNGKTTINFSRKDVENNTEYEYSLTYGKSQFDHRVPMYDSDWFAVDRFAELVL